MCHKIFVAVRGQPQSSLPSCLERGLSFTALHGKLGGLLLESPVSISILPLGVQGCRCMLPGLCLALHGFSGSELGSSHFPGCPLPVGSSPQPQAV